MNLLDDINMDAMGMDGTGMKKGVMWKLHNDTDPECPQECFGNCANVSGRNGDGTEFWIPLVGYVHTQVKEWRGRNIGVKELL